MHDDPSGNASTIGYFTMAKFGAPRAIPFLFAENCCILYCTVWPTRNMLTHYRVASVLQSVSRQVALALKVDRCGHGWWVAREQASICRTNPSLHRFSSPDFSEAPGLPFDLHLIGPRLAELACLWLATRRFSCGEESQDTRKLGSHLCLASPHVAANGLSPDGWRFMLNLLQRLPKRMNIVWKRASLHDTADADRTRKKTSNREPN